jgi:hypothetical protein
VETVACYDEAVFSEDKMIQIMQLFDRVFERIVVEPESLVGDLQMALSV